MKKSSQLLMLSLLLAAVAASAQQTPSAGNPHGAMDLDCSLCHDEGSWDISGALRDFNHAATGFPLEGRHATAHCRDCHEDPRFAFVGTSCADCHADIHKGRLGVDCAQCHTPQGWVQRSEQRRAHDATGFALVGAHDRVDCDACHTGPLAGDYVGTPTECYFCHAETYAATTDPDHQTAGFHTDCQECHSAYSSTWGSGDFTHPASFPLTGAHANLECASCHSDGFGGAVADCYACHQEDFEGTDDPGHVAAGFPVTCAICHTTTAWEPAQYDHNLTGFALTGAHRSLDCLSCHEAGYVNTPSDCYACHQEEFDTTTDPDHIASNFPTECAVCHSTTAWEPADFDHSTTGFALTGAHTTTDCLSCHETGYVNTPSDCYACHQSDFEGTTDPNHVASGFGTDCQACHSTTAWEPSTWDHDTLFPIYSGRHRGEWDSCVDCHLVPSNYAAFECIFCHEHNQADTDSRHIGEVNDYQYNSQACFDCHPRGEAEN